MRFIKSLNNLLYFFVLSFLWRVGKYVILVSLISFELFYWLATEVFISLNVADSLLRTIAIFEKYSFFGNFVGKCFNDCSIQRNSFIVLSDDFKNISVIGIIIQGFNAILLLLLLIRKFFRNFLANFRYLNFQINFFLLFFAIMFMLFDEIDYNHFLLYISCVLVDPIRWFIFITDSLDFISFVIRELSH